MPHFDLSLARGLAAALLVAGCSKVTMIQPEDPLEISAKPPALPLPDLPAVKQPPPPPPPRVVIEKDDVLGSEALRLDEAIVFDEHDELSAENQDILAEVANWLTANPDVLKLTVHVWGAREGKKGPYPSKSKRTRAMATQIVEALVEAGVPADRLVAKGGGGRKTDPIRVSLVITERAEEKPQ